MDNRKERILKNTNQNITVTKDIATALKSSSMVSGKS